MTDLEIIQNEITEEIEAFMANSDKMRAVYMVAQNLFGLSPEEFKKDKMLRIALIGRLAMKYPEPK